MVEIEIIKPDIDEMENKRRIDEINDFITEIVYNREAISLSDRVNETKLRDLL